MDHAKLFSNPWYAVEGSPSPLGSTWIEPEKAWNFALYSKHASAVTLLLYTEQEVQFPVLELALNPLRNRSGRVWHCRLKEDDMGNARYYAYRVVGPNDLRAGHRFYPQKILLDPYAKAVFFPPQFNRRSAFGAGSNDGRAPLGLIDSRLPPFDWGDDTKPRHTNDAILYELHVRGFSQRTNSGVAEANRGTFQGIIEKIPYLKELGVTVLELMPIYQFDPQEGNYWGYMTLNFFALHQDYLADPNNAVNEFRSMVKALHEADIEVILDVVYNHTTELGAFGPTYSFRGIDNSTYYLLDKDNLTAYRNDTGTGNVLRASHPAVRKLIMDSLRYWVQEMHVDGFRFDLASIFTRNDDGSINTTDSPIISEISSDPCFEGIRLIAEAWDLASYQLGRAFPGITWQQWNGKYRDALRSFVKSDNGVVAELMARLYGSDDLFPGLGGETYHPYQSVNFITAHDGFCLYDLVSYNQKHNLANGEQNRDGTDDNRSWNGGWEGDVGLPHAVAYFRQRQIKNFCTLLLLSNGMPMIVAGDEFGHSQGGNNNPYNQDNETTWLDWDKLATNQAIFRFFKAMIAFRKRHPSLARSRFWREDITWYGTTGIADIGYFSHALAFLLKGVAEGDNDLYVMINSYWEDLLFDIQDGSIQDWVIAINTAGTSPNDIFDLGVEPPLDNLKYLVKARSIVVLRHK